MLHVLRFSAESGKEVGIWQAFKLKKISKQRWLKRCHG